MREEIEELISEGAIANRLDEMARAIDADYPNQSLLVIGILNGTILFLSDLVRKISRPLKLDFVGVSSYRDGRESGNLTWTKELSECPSGSHVLIIEDILETGKTLNAVMDAISKKSPASLKTCVLLNKSVDRTFPIEPDYTGFSIGNEFVVGFGLDYAGRYRNLPFIGILHLHENDAPDPSSRNANQSSNSNKIAVSVQFWSVYQGIAGTNQAEIHVPQGTSLDDFKLKAAELWPGLKLHLGSMLIAVGNDYCEGKYILSEGDALSLFPPVQGG